MVVVYLVSELLHTGTEQVMQQVIHQISGAENIGGGGGGEVMWGGCHLKVIYTLKCKSRQY